MNKGGKYSIYTIKIRILMEFFCVLTKYRKKFDKYIKSNKIKNKYIIDIKDIINSDELDFNDDKTYLKILIFRKIERAIEKNKDIYYLPDIENDFSIEKLLNLKKILGDNNFNVILFCNDFSNRKFIVDDVLNNLTKFNNSKILKE